MSDLTAFLSQNAIKKEPVKHVASGRFLDSKKKPMEWIIQPLTSQEDEDLRKQATKRVPVPGRKHQYQPETDYNKYLGLLAVKCTMFPDLFNKELQDSYGVMGADALLKKMLLPGEYSDYVEKVQEVNGFEVTLEDKVEEAKN